MAELVDALDLGSSTSRFGGSSPPSRTKYKIKLLMDNINHDFLQCKNCIRDVIFLYVIRVQELETAVPAF